MKKIIVLLLISGLVVGAGILLKKRMQEVENASLPIPMTRSVKVVSSKEASLRQTRPFLSQLRSIDSANIASKMNGRIEAVPVTENQPVNKGDLLVRIDDRETVSAIISLEKTLKSREADLKYTETQHTRNKAIFKVGGLAREKLEASEVALAGKQAAVEATRQDIAIQQIRLGYLNIRAPFDGTVATIFLRKGNLATPGKPLLSIFSSGQKLTFSYVPKKPFILPGQAVFLGTEKIGKILKRYSDAKNGLSVAEVVLDTPLAQPTIVTLPLTWLSFRAKVVRFRQTHSYIQKKGNRLWCMKTAGSSLSPSRSGDGTGIAPSLIPALHSRWRSVQRQS